MHGLYSINLERFILLDQDRWALLHTGKMLSSKMQLCLCQFDNDIAITNNDCINWTTTGTAVIPQDQQILKFSHIGNSLKYIGPPNDVDLDLLTQHIDYVKFVLKVIKAAWLTEAIRGIGDQTYFLSLVEENTLVSFKDETWADGGFLFAIDKILYLSKNKEEALPKIKKIFENPDTAMPTVLAGYKATFFEGLRND